MADRTRLAAAGLFLALALAAVPALLPVRLAGVGIIHRAEAVRPLVHLRRGPLTAPLASQPELVPEGVLQVAISQVAPRSHTVAPGETLWRISSDTGISVQALAAANHLTLGTTLHPGQVLTVPPLDPASPQPPQLTHEVEAGETLWGISRASGVRVEALAAGNHLSLDAVLHPGQTLVIPAQEDAGPSLSIALARTRHRVPAGTGAQVASAFRSLAADVRSLAQPTEGLITSRFGWRTHPIFGTREFHTGLDIANRIGTPIRAAESGVVRFVGWMSGYGRLIIVAHANGLETSYSHLSSMLVALGQRVVRGDVLGHMGNTGWSTGSHLLFEVRRNGVPLDPIPFLQGRSGTLVQAADLEVATARPTHRPAVPPSTKPAPASGGPAAAPPSSTEHPVVTELVTQTLPDTPRR
jgi:murein DD-endopeptidase MepM/ murein hydrolase activator NlpD